MGGGFSGRINDPACKPSQSTTSFQRIRVAQKSQRAGGVTVGAGLEHYHQVSHIGWRVGSSLPGKQFADGVGHDVVSAEPAWVCALVVFWTMVCNVVCPRRQSDIGLIHCCEVKPAQILPCLVHRHPYAPQRSGNLVSIFRSVRYDYVSPTASWSYSEL